MRSTVLALALVLAVSPALAFPAPDKPLLDTVAFDAAHSVAWRALLPKDSFFSVWMEADHEDLAFGSFALWYVDAATGQFEMLFNPTWYPEGGHEQHVQVGDAGTFVSTLSGNAQWPIELRVDFQPNSDREWIVVALGAFDGQATGEWRAYGDGGATILASTRGGAFLHTERDFAGAANVVAREELPARETVLEGKVQLDAAVSERAEGRMFASFWGGDHLGLQRISYAGPDGGDSGRASYLVAGGPAGEYEFRIDQNVDWHDNQPTCRALNAERCWRVPAFVVGADIVSP